jgi:subtilisin family serine protease
MNRNFLTPLVSCLAIFSSLIAVNAVLPKQTDGSGANLSAVDTSAAIVQFQANPLSTAANTRPSRGAKINFNSPAVGSYRAQLNQARNAFKKWLQANGPAAKVTSEYDISLNAVAVQLNGVTLDALRQGPGVASVEYVNVYKLCTSDPDLGLIQAMQAWQVGGGSANAGDGVKVAMIDSGIDINHPCFSDAGYPPQSQIGDKRFTNNKVIAAKVFNRDAAKLGYTPEAIQFHGTHTAGTVACNYNTPAVTEGVAIPFGVSGVAPRALLGNYNVFPANVASARDQDLLNALEAAYADGFDIANMSLGGTAKTKNDALMKAVNDLDKANMVVAIAAGNAGPGYGTVQSPGAAARALTAGASSVPHFIGTPITAGGNTVAAASGDFGTVSSNLTATLAVVSDNGSLSEACSPLSVDLTGKIALISRGTCSFSAKIRDAQAAGAIAAIVVNNVVGDPIEMGGDGTTNQPTIPAYMIGLADQGTLIVADGTPVTLGAAFQYFQTANADIMADFSGEGPTLDFRIKPDVVAPGVNVLSSLPVAYCGGDPCWAFFDGTSMATPHLAGSAAIIHWLYPNWSAVQVRSAIVNTADRNVLRDFNQGAPELDILVAGAGRENLLAAATTSVTLDPVSVSFGQVPVMSGSTRKMSVILSNVSSNSATFSVTVGQGDSSVLFFATPPLVTLSAGQSTVVTVSMTAAKGGAAGPHESLLTISSNNSEVAHAGVLSWLK